MEDIDKYLQSVKFKLGKESSNKEENAKEMYEYAQLLTSVCKHDEAIDYFKESFQILEVFKDDPIWGRLYVSVGSKYAMCLDYKAQYEAAGEVFDKLNKQDPDGYHIADYALFLHRRKRDFERAKGYYLKALALYPHHSSVHLKYAGFLRHIRRDIPGAEKYYKSAVKESPSNADALGSYASFLHGVHNNIKEAENYYAQSVAADDTHTNNLCNYGLFLSEEKNSYDLAEKMYKRALEVHDKHANTLYNYAVMLDTHLKRKKEAERLYRRALDVEPRHAYALYNIAVLLEERYSANILAASNNDRPDATPAPAGNDEAVDAWDQQVQETTKVEILNFYQRAVEADPRDPTTMADYGRYLLIRMEKITKAEEILHAALKMDPSNEIAIFNLAIIAHRHKNDLNGAEKLLRQLLQSSPKHNAGLLQLARLLADKHAMRGVTATATGATQVLTGAEALVEEICALYETCIETSKEAPAVATEYLKLIEKIGNNQQKLRTIAAMATQIDQLPKKSENIADTVEIAAPMQSAKTALERLRKTTR